MSTKFLTLDRNELGPFLRPDFEGLRNEGYLAAQNPAASELDCPHISTRFITAWRKGFRSARLEMSKKAVPMR